MSTTPADLIAAYEASTPKLRAAVQGMSREDLLAAPVAGKWSTQTLIIHVVDGENAFVDRMKRIIAMDHSVLLEWSEHDFINKLHYDAQSAEDAITAFEAQRRNMTAILKALTPAEFDRVGEHSSRGRWTLAFTLERADWHLNHHLGFIPEKRKALGK